ncbi:hypothetical protein BCR42DRAFT_385851 [Absidia repens]|uniref:Uncharacterized protein n=1 Tax=Absidia repens TaxID=90262 RepID=A0A1X2J060_9FUNG|nr:hypothetical protein BCR42DRAFT_385851 [Absidia repens]
MPLEAIGHVVAVAIKTNIIIVIVIVVTIIFIFIFIVREQDQIGHLLKSWYQDLARHLVAFEILIQFGQDSLDKNIPKREEVEDVRISKTRVHHKMNNKGGGGGIFTSIQTCKTSVAGETGETGDMFQAGFAVSEEEGLTCVVIEEGVGGRGASWPRFDVAVFVFGTMIVACNVMSDVDNCYCVGHFQV